MRRLRRGAPWRLALAAGAAVPAVVGGAGEDPLEGLSLERLGALVSLELQAEDERGPESLLTFGEFQAVSELGCDHRLLYLLNETAVAASSIHGYHADVLGVSGLLARLLQHAPQENSWLWLVTSSHHRLLQKVHTYWSRVCALALDQHQCLPTDVKSVVLGGVARWRDLHADFAALLWNAFAFGVHGDAPALHERQRELAAGSAELPPLPAEKLAMGNAWISSVLEWFGGYVVELHSALQRLQLPAAGQEGLSGAQRLHHQDEQGSFVAYESLRRQVFKQWAIDKGLLRGLLRHVWRPPLGDGPPVTLGDFGAGGGHYSTWLNETGLIRSYAFDGTRGAAELTGGAVQEINLVEEMGLWRDFDWVMCLEVGEHIPRQFSQTLLQNLRRHARHGLIMSWSEDWEGIGHVNCLPRGEFIELVERETGFRLDADATEAVKESCDIDYIARTIAVFRAAPAA